MGASAARWSKRACEVDHFETVICAVVHQGSLAIAVAGDNEEKSKHALMALRHDITKMLRNLGVPDDDGVWTDNIATRLHHGEVGG